VKFDAEENNNMEPDAEKLWLDVAERRLAEMKSGKVKSVDAFDAIALMRNTLQIG